MRRRWPGAVIVSMLIIAACAPAAAPPSGGSPSRTTAEATAAPTKAIEPAASAKIAGVPTLEAMAPALVASQEGFFKGANLDVGDIVMAEGGRVRDALVAKDVDFIDIGISAILTGMDKGLPIKVVGGVLDTEIFGLWVRQDLADRVKSVKDLKGLNIGVPSPGSAMWVATIYYLKKAGLGEKDVNFVSLGSVDPAVYMTALQAKQIDAAGLFPTTLAVSQLRALVFPLVDITEPDTLKQYFGAGKSTSMVLATRQDVIDSNPQLVQRVVEAHSQSLQFIASHTSTEIAQAAAPGLKMDVQVASNALDMIKPAFAPDGRISKSGTEAQIDMNYQAGVISRPLKYEEVVDDRFAGGAP